MAPMALALILGWWLVAASRAQQLPPPSLSLHPSQGVSLGDTVTLRCHLPQLAARVELCQEGYRGTEMCKDMDVLQDTAEFSLVNVRRKDAVKYWCQYRVFQPPGTSKKSDPVELLVTGEDIVASRWPWSVPIELCSITVSSLHSDHSYPPPGISLIPKESVELGTNVTIQCWNQEYGGIIFLHKAGHSAPIQHQVPDGGGTATFTIFGVTPSDSGTYRCSYRIGGSSLLLSPLGDNVTLEVISRPVSPGDNGRPHGNLVAAVAGGCAAAIAFILVVIVSFLLAAHRRQIRRDENPGATTRSPKAVQFQVSPADSQALTYAQLQVLTPSTHPPGSSTTPEPSVIYAQVGTGGPR
uniref:Immunoglobulin domain-containing protein n=1 Tax=Meleagris gallopavo TaxID=9103 RepID=A0A803XTF7_MELGA